MRELGVGLGGGVRVRGEYKDIGEGAGGKDCICRLDRKST